MIQKNNLILVLIGAIFLLSACDDKKNSHFLRFSTSAEYPPFEYKDHGVIKGFDIDLAHLIARELGKEAIFDSMQFSTVLPAVSSGQDDVAIATITITEERKKNFDFSEPYFFEGMAAVYKTDQPVTNLSQLKGKKLAVQLGTVMEIWLRKNYPDAEITALDNNNQAVEALMGGHVDAVVMDGVQGRVFSKKHPGLSYALVAQADNGYALVLPKGSPLTQQINNALQKLEARGELKKLETKWLKGDL